MAGSIGYAVLPVVPSTKDFQKKLNKEVLSAVNGSGKKASSKLTKDFKSAFAELEKASVKAQKAQEKSINQVTKAEEKLQKLRERNANRQRITENKEKSLNDTRIRLAERIAKQEQKIQRMRESGRSSLERIKQEEEKLQKIRSEAPGKILKKETDLKKSRQTGRNITKSLEDAEKKLAQAQKNSAEATKKASSLQEKLNGKEGQAAKRKDAIRSSIQKVAIAYQKFERSVAVAGKAIGNFSVKIGSGVLSSIKKLGSTVANTANTITRSLGGAVIGQVQKFTNFIKSSMNRAVQAITAAGTAVAGASIFKGFQRLSAIEESTVKLKTFGIDVENAMSQANEAVKGTAFGLGDAATATAQMSAAGVKLGNDMKQSLGLIADTAAISGASFSEIASVYSKIAAAGKLDGGTLDQLQDRGVAVLAALSDASGKTQQEIRKNISDGKVSYQEFADAMEATIGGAAKRSGETVKGSFANLGAALGRIGASMQEKLFSKLPIVFGNLTQAIDNAAPAIVTSTSGITDKLTGKLVEFSQKILELSTKIPQMMQNISQNPAFISLKNSFDTIKNTIISIMPIIASMVGSTIIAGFTILGQAAQAVAVSIKNIKNASGETSNELTTNYTSSLQKVTDITGQVFGAIPGIVSSIATSPVWITLKNVILSIVNTVKVLAPAFGAVAIALGSGVWNIASSVFHSISDGLNKSKLSAEPFADVIQNRLVPWIEVMTSKISSLIQQYLPGIVTLMAEKIPQAINIMANDPAFVKARENIFNIAKEVIKLLPVLAQLSASGALIGFTLLNETLKAIAPLLENIVLPALSNLSRYLAENQNVAKMLAFTLGGIFLGGKIVKGIEVFVGVFSKFKPVIKAFKYVMKVLPKIGPLIGGVGKALMGLIAANPIGAIIVAIAAATTALVVFFTKTKTGRAIWAKTVNFMKETWDNYGKPIFIGIGNIVKWLWNKIVRPFFGWMKHSLSIGIGSIIKVKNTFIYVGNSIKNSFSSVKDRIKLINESIKNSFSSVKDRVFGIINSIKKMWNSLRDTLSKPIKFGVDGVKGLWGKVRGKKDKYSSGGVLPGYTPGRDVHHYINPTTGHILSLSGGEAIMRPEWVRQNGGTAGINRMNRLASRSGSSMSRTNTKHSKYASGGIVKLSNSGNNNANFNIKEANINAKDAKITPEKIKERTEKRISQEKELSDARAALYAATHKDAVGQAVSETMQKKAALSEINSKIANSKKLGLSAHDVKVLKVQRLTASKEFQDALTQPMKVAMDKAAEHRKNMGDLRADNYAKIHEDPVGQAIAERMKAFNNLQDLEYQKKKAIMNNEPKDKIEEFSLQIENAALDAKKAAKNVLITSMETAANHKKAVSDLNADFYAQTHKDAVGQAVADRMKQEASLNDLIEQRKRALLEGQPVETIREFGLQIRNASYALSEASENIRKVRDEQRDTHRTNMRMLRADWLSKSNEDNPVMQSRAEFLRSSAEASSARYELRRAKKYGASIEEITEANLKLKNAQLDMKSAYKKYVQSINQERADIIKHNGTMRSKELDIYESKYFDNENAMRMASIARARNNIKDAKDALYVAKITKSSRMEIAELSKDVELAQANYVKAQKEAQKQLLETQTSQYEETHEYLKSWSDSLEKTGNSLVDSFEIIASIGKDLYDLSRGIIEGTFSIFNGISEIIKSFSDITTAERTLQKTRVEGLASIAKAQGDLNKTSKKNLHFIDTSASRLLSTDKTAFGFYNTIDKIGGTFKTSTEDILKSRAALAEARAQAAMETAKAEFELKKARLESSKKILDQVKATGLLNVSMAEYIAKAKLINGMNSRDTDSLSKYYKGAAQRSQGISMMRAAQAQIAWAQRTGNTAKYQEALGQYYEGQKYSSLGAYQMQLYVKEATKTFNSLPSDISKGLREVIERDNNATNAAVNNAIKRGDYYAANAAAKNAGALISSYIDTITGYRQLQNELITRNAQYQRENIEFAGKIADSIFDLSGSKLQNSFDKTNQALQANLDGAQALVKAAETDNNTEKKIWSDYALKSLSDYEKSKKDANAYNKGSNNNYIIDIPKGSAYSSEEVADYMASATKRIDNIEIRLNGKSVEAQDYFNAH